MEHPTPHGRLISIPLVLCATLSAMVTLSPRSAQAQAQTLSSPHAGPATSLLSTFWLDDVELDAVAFGAGEAAGARVVKGVPYCADAVRESVQTLADGNRIVKQASTRLCRDSEGRTRQEVERGGRKLVWLRDPVAQETWLLDPEKKTARKYGSAAASLGGFGADASRAWHQDFAQRMRELADRMRDSFKDGRSAPGAPPLPPLPPLPSVAPLPSAAPVVITESVVRDASGPAQAESRLRVLRIESGAGDGVPAVSPSGSSPRVVVHTAPRLEIPLPPAVSWRAHAAAPRGPGVVTPLGSKDIEGVRAHGERTTWTIEAGKVGNEKPIVIMREVWTSPELLVTLLSTDSDPRSGQTGYRLAHLQRGEPDAALMRVPADYSTTPPQSTPPPRR